jgi:hypothetical protein
MARNAVHAATATVSASGDSGPRAVARSWSTMSQGLTLVHVRAQLEQFQDTFMS